MFNTTFYIAVFLFHHLLSAACMTVCLTIHSLVKIWFVVRVKDYLVCNLSKSNILSMRSHIHACIFSFSSSIHVHYLMDCVQTRFLFFCQMQKILSYLVWHNGFITFTHINISAIFGIYVIFILSCYVCMKI